MRKDPRVDAYIERSAPFARPILRHLRGLVRLACPGAEETMKWSMPAWLSGGRIVCGMAAFKGHCSFYFWHPAMKEEIGRDREPAGEGMGSFGRITAPGDLPADAAMRRYLEKAVSLAGSGGPARPRPARRKAPPAEVPADLAAALEADGKAAAFFATLRPSHRREYVDWIVEAKREATRRTRIATAVGWLAEGRTRNWKYESC